MARSYSIIPGIILIAIGTLLLLNRLDIYYFRWATLYPIILMFLGAIFMSRAFGGRDKGAIFPGTILFLVGLFFFLRNNYWLPFYYFRDSWPVFVLIIGIAFVALYAVKPYDWGVLIPGGLFLLLGSAFLLDRLHYLPWGVREILGQLWPVALIILGIAILVGSLKRSEQ